MMAKRLVKVPSVVAQFTPNNIHNSNRKAITKKTYSTALSPLFNWLMTQGVIKENPVSEVRLDRVPSKFPRFLTPEDVMTLSNTMEQGGYSGLSFAVQANVYLGLRIWELINLEWSAVDLERRTITIVNTNEFSTRSRKERSLPIAKPVHDLLSTLTLREGFVFKSAKGTQMNKQNTSRKFTTFARLVGLHECTFHTTKHTAASGLTEQWRRFGSIWGIRASV